ncbi:hypothetical protein RUM44_002004 [Polyplax serrata]|uniref:Sodium/calcium exchanger membrane region domain-containing protein n=1 Tax=Polyplax serrata TaxID=468196 RepID=A0ABR1ALN2_POLSC
MVSNRNLCLLALLEEKEDEDADLFKAYFVHYEDSISLRRISASSRGSAFSERRKSVKSMKERKLSEVRRRSHNLQTGETYLTELPVSKLPETIEENNSNDSGRGDPEEVKEEQTFRSIFCVFPSDTLWNKFTWLALWPICFLFFWTIPDCRSERWKKFYALTFLMCIIWIGIYCYSGTWLISAIGTTFGIPDAVMGLTLLAIGGSMPEAISTYIMARQGEGGLGFSNSLGGNTMDICLCLGFPWLIMCIKEGSVGTFVKIISEGLQYNCLALVLGIVVLISVGVYTKFHMNRTMGFICCIFYVIFTVVSVLFYEDGYQATIKVRRDKAGMGKNFAIQYRQIPLDGGRLQFTKIKCLIILFV